MTQRQKQHDHLESIEYNDSCTYESCFYCGEEFIYIEDILVDERDRYICEECSIVYRVDAVRCREID